MGDANCLYVRNPPPPDSVSEAEDAELEAPMAIKLSQKRQYQLAQAAVGDPMGETNLMGE
jgi:hypothetical protein